MDAALKTILAAAGITATSICSDSLTLTFKTFEMFEAFRAEDCIVIVVQVEFTVIVILMKIYSCCSVKTFKFVRRRIESHGPKAS